MKKKQPSIKKFQQTDKDDTVVGQSGAKGKGKQENKNTADNTRTIEIITLSEVTTCGTCGEDLTHVPACACERCTKSDIIFEKTVEHIDAEIKHCPSCGEESKGVFPNDMAGPKQYGNGLKAYIINLIVSQMVSLNRVQKMIKAMMGVVMAEATLLRYVVRLHEALASWEVKATEKILKSPSIHADETALRVDKKNQWIHIVASGDITIKFLDPKRGKEALENITIIPRYGGAIIHDGWASYLSYDHKDHGLCGAHLLRELTFIQESNGYAWSATMKRLLKDMGKQVSKSEKKLSHF